jgi:Flp pilus assembly protein TadG
MVSVAVPMLAIASALAIDLNRYLKVGGYVQAAVDQAAIAGTAVDGQDRVEVATRFFNASLNEEFKQYII